MKKISVIITLLIMFALAFTSLIACGGKEEVNYFSLTINQRTGGVLQFELIKGEVQDGKYKSGSTIKLKATAESGYEVVAIVLGGQSYETTEYEFVIKSNIVARAEFIKLPLASLALARVGEAISNSYDLSEYDEENGISGRLTQIITDQDNFTYNLVTEFSLGNGLTNSFLSMNLNIGAVTLLGVHYLDLVNNDEGRIYITMPGFYNVYVKTLTIREITEYLTYIFSDTPLGEGELEGEAGDFISLDLLEMIGILYGIENVGSTSKISLNLTALLSLFIELAAELSEEVEYFNIYDFLPQIDIALRVDYIVEEGIERIGEISYKVESAEKTIGEGEDRIVIGAFSLDVEMEATLNMWREEVPFNIHDATETTLEGLLEILEDIYDLITNLGE